MEKETRMIECPHCCGDGGHETVTGYDPRNGETTGHWTTCHACEGRREIEIEVEPVILEDLEMTKNPTLSDVLQRRPGETDEQRYRRVNQFLSTDEGVRSKADDRDWTGSPIFHLDKGTIK